MSVVQPEIEYPFSDGKPLAESTKQLRWITIWFDNLMALYRDRRHDVFVGGDNFWYPVEGEPKIVVAPDVYIVVGAEHKDRLSYKQWEEGDVPVTVAVEVWSHTNTQRDKDEKLQFYDEHGVQEYYTYDPETDELIVYVRGRATLARQRPVHHFRSPVMGVRFDTSGPELRIIHPNGEPFIMFHELKALHEQARLETAAAQGQTQAAQLETAAARAQTKAAHLETAAAQAQTQAAHLETAAVQAQTLAAHQMAAVAQADLLHAQEATANAVQQLTATQQRLARISQLTALVLAGQATPEQLAELQTLLAAT